MLQVVSTAALAQVARDEVGMKRTNFATLQRLLFSSAQIAATWYHASTLRHIFSSRARLAFVSLYSDSTCSSSNTIGVAHGFGNHPTWFDRDARAAHQRSAR